MTEETDGAQAPMIIPAAAGNYLPHLASRVLGRPMLLHPSKAEIVVQVLEGRIGLGEAVSTPLPLDASRFLGSGRHKDGSKRLTPIYNNIGLITIDGGLVNRGAWVGTSSGLVSYEGIAAQLREAAADSDIKTIVTDLHSPGGEAGGMFALASLVAEVNKTKPVIAVVNDMAASAAYGIASAASEIVVSPTSLVGSIGVVMTHVDRSGELAAKGQKVTLIYAGAHKVDGHPFGSLSDAVRADMMREVENLYAQFTGLVGRGRGSRLDEAAARATEARVFIGEEAVTRGLADRVASLDEVLAELSSNRGASASAPKTRRVNMTEQTKGAEAQANTEATAAQLAAARAEGAASERTRIAGILRHAEAEGRTAQAATLALETDLSAEQAGKVLAASPKESPAAASAVPSIGARAAAEAEIGGGPLPASAAEASKSGWSKAVKAANTSIGVASA